MGAGSGGMKGDMPMKSHDDIPSGRNHDMSESISDEKMKGQSAMPGQSKMEESGPPALLHIGAKGFFIDRPQTFTPRADQAKVLSDIKDRTTMETMTADKNPKKPAQQLWKLTASDHPDLAEIEVQMRGVEKLWADQRVAFIRSVAEAAMSQIRRRLSGERI